MSVVNEESLYMHTHAQHTSTQWAMMDRNVVILTWADSSFIQGLINIK